MRCGRARAYLVVKPVLTVLCLRTSRASDHQIRDVGGRKITAQGGILKVEPTGGRHAVDQISVAFQAGGWDHVQWSMCQRCESG